MRTSIFNFIAILTIIYSACFNSGSMNAQSYQPTPENIKMREEFQNDKFGIFLHWGLYSMMAQGEWYMQIKNLNYKEYAKFASGFDPQKFDAKKWVEEIKNSGAKYICFTSRHHEGFSMFHTRWSDYNIVDATPFKRDIVKELTDECHKQGIKVFLYYSLLDWSREDYYPLGSTGQGTGRVNHGKWETYHQFMLNQLTELLTNYGKIDGIWFDGLWDQPKDFDWKISELYNLIHKYQPACLVGNNHHSTPLDGEDFQMFERDLPGQNQSGFSGQKISALPLETCETMNGMWGYKIEDQSYKSCKELVQYIVKAAGNNANLLMNIGPMPTGELPELAIDRLQEVGKWMSKYGETIYGTRQGDVLPHEWGVTTRKGNKLFVHILNTKDNTIFLPMTKKVKNTKVFGTESKVFFEQNKYGVTLNIVHAPNQNDYDYIIELTTK